MVAPEDERIEDPWGYMDGLAHEFLPLKKWGFRESARRGSWPKVVSLWPGIIYDSKWCRVLFLWDGWEMYTGNSISILYGRLHAPDDKVTMIRDGEECYCWHRLELALHFLDERTPEYAARYIYSHPLKRKFRQLDLEFKLTGKRNQPEWLVRMHAMIWEHYAPRLFEVFDLRRPDLWEQYRQYMKEICDIKGRGSKIGPSLDLDKIC